MATTEKGIYYPTDYTKAADVPDDMKKLAESVDEAIGNIPQYDDTGIKKDISDLKKEQSTQNKQISDNTKKNTQQDTEISKLQTRVQQLQANMINETTDEATSLHVTDVAELPAKLEVGGNHKQEMQEGTDNLAVLNEGTITKNGVTVNIQNGVATTSGKATQATIIILGTAYLVAGKTYYISKSVNGGGFFLRNTTNNQHWFNDGELSFVAETTEKWEVYASFAQNDTGGLATTFTVSETSGAEWVEGKAPMPSIPYPSEIETVKDEVNVVVTNKNRFNVPSKNQNGIDLVLQEDGSYLINGTSTTNWVYRYGDYIWLTKGKYTISVENLNVGSTFFGIMGAGIKYETNTNYTFTLQKDSLVRCYFTCANAVNFENAVVKVQLEKSEAKTEWVKHEEESYVLDVQQEMLQGDYFIKEADGWKEVHGWGKRTFTGGFSMNYGTSIFNYPNNDIVNQATHNRDALCNMFKFDTRTYGMTNMENGYFATQPEYNAIFFKEESCTTAEEFNAKLAELNSEGNPLTVFYKTQTPTKLPCTEAQSEVLEQLSELELFKGTNNIITAENLALLQITYTVDTKAYIDSKLGSEV